MCHAALQLDLIFELVDVDPKLSLGIPLSPYLTPNINLIQNLHTKYNDLFGKFGGKISGMLHASRELISVNF